MKILRLFLDAYPEKSPTKKSFGNRLTLGCGELYSLVFIRIVLFLKKRLGNHLSYDGGNSFCFLKKLADFRCLRCLRYTSRHIKKRALNECSFLSRNLYKIYFLFTPAIIVFLTGIVIFSLRVPHL